MKKILSFLFLFLIFSARAHASAPEPNDFAYGIGIEAAGENALYYFQLPAEVYQGVLYQDLGDIRIFNGNNEPLPFEVKSPRPEAEDKELLALPIFPIKAGSAQAPGSLDIKVKLDKEGSIIKVGSKLAVKGRARTLAYILDASLLKKSIAALVLDWQSPSGGFIGRIRVEASDDLQYWSEIVGSATLSDLKYGDYKLDRHEVEVPDIKPKYLRISFTETTEEIDIKTVSARLSSGMREPERQWLNVAANQAKDMPGDYLFDTRGHMPLDRIRIRLPEKNTLVNITLFSRQTEKEPWTIKYSGIAYDLNVKENRLLSPDITTGPTRDRYWKMSVSQEGGGLGRALPVLEVGWVPEDLIFLARGNSPFILAYGRGGKGKMSGSGGSMVESLVSEHKDLAAAAPARLLGKVALGGEESLKVRRQLDWKKLLLWSLLISGVLLLGLMVLKLQRRIKAGN